MKNGEKFEKMIDQKIKDNLLTSKSFGKTDTIASRIPYRKEMVKAAQDSEFIKDNKDVMRDFAFLDREVFDMWANDTLSSNADKPIYRRDEKGIFRFYPDGRKIYVREKRFANSRLRGL
jgi:hypothetical protein